MAEDKANSKSKKHAAADVVRDKVSDLSLKRFAASDSTRSLTVLLELELPQPKLKIGATRRIGSGELPRRSLSISPSEQHERSERISEVTRSLDHAGVKNKPLSSGTIIAKVSPHQLRDVAKLDLVKTIVPNRKRTF